MIYSEKHHSEVQRKYIADFWLLLEILFISPVYHFSL